MSNDGKKQTLETMVLVEAIKQSSNSELGITQEYNKENRDKLWDSTKGKAEYKNQVFRDKQTYEDPISGKTLHKSQKAAQNRYHMKNKTGENISSKWAEHSAETDHINSLKNVHNIAKHNPFLSDSDFKEIVNSNENYRILSKSSNTSKGEKSDWQVILNKDSAISAEGKIQILKEKVGADVALQTKFASRTAQNMGREFASGATDTLIKSTIPLTVEAVREMVKVAQGEENLKDAAKDIGKISTQIAVTGGTNRLIIDAATNQLVGSKNSMLKNIANSNGVAQIIVVATIVQEAAIKYIDGKIDGKEFIEEVGEKGTAMVAGMIGGQVGSEIGGMVGGILGTMALPGVGTGVGVVAGEVIGEMLGIMITTVACSSIISIFNTTKNLNNYKLKECQIRKLEADALAEIKKQRTDFRKLVEKEYKIWDETIQSGFDQMLRCACEETYNLQGVTDGLDRILSVFGKEVAFKTIDDYEKQLDKTLKLSF